METLEIEGKTYEELYQLLYGKEPVWTKERLIEFLKSIRPYINNWSYEELIIIINKRKLNSQFQDNPTFHKMVLTPPSDGDERRELLEQVIGEIESGDFIDSEDDSAFNEDIDDLDTEDILNDSDDLLPPRPRVTVQSLQFLDTVASTFDSDDVEFLINIRIKMMWQDILSGNNTIAEEVINTHNYGKNFEILRTRFKKEYEAVINMKIPEGFQYKENGMLITPSLMQKLVCYRVAKDLKYGNWSGTGAGKTLSAIISSRFIKAKITLVIAHEPTISKWASDILNAFPNSNVIVKDKDNSLIQEGRHNYIVLNYHTFQNFNVREYIKSLVDNYQIDFIILDEIQAVKRRSNDLESNRRQLIESLITAANTKNSNLHVLGMSATPVINNLEEAKGLLQLITCDDAKFEGLKTQPTLNNCLEIYKNLVNHGLRFIPKYDISVSEEHIKIYDNSKLEELKSIRNEKKRNNHIKIEKATLDIKLKYIFSKGHVRRGTLLYTHFVDGFIEPIRDYCIAYGFKYVILTGSTDRDQKEEALTKIRKGEVDVIIGSSVVSTGIDGLQYYFNKVIMVSLPWTSAEYDQIKGRIYRQGSNFKEVEIVVPHVIMKQGDTEWSFDRDYRYKIIKFKRGISDSAVDGVIPTTSKLPSKQNLANEALSALDEWINHLNK